MIPQSDFQLTIPLPNVRFLRFLPENRLTAFGQTQS